MGGQDGYSRDLLSYTEDTSSILAGINVKPSDSWAVGLNLGYTQADGGLAPFDLPADDYVANTPSMSFDFSRSHTYSNIDVNRFNLDAMFKYKFANDIWLRLWYQYIDFTDNDPYLYDTTGAVQWGTVSAGWSF